MRKTKSKKTKGGAATVFPLKYFNSSAIEPAVSAGRDLLYSTSSIVRPKIGGGKSITKKRKQRGGFVPSVMDGFVMAASKYIVPIVLYAGYKLMTKKNNGKSKRGTKRSQRK
jgi:hypothetical protein